MLDASRFHKSIGLVSVLVSRRRIGLNACEHYQPRTETVGTATTSVDGGDSNSVFKSSTKHLDGLDSTKKIDLIGAIRTAT
jgi:hypothetical protein